jgi:uncharacterized protein GlcG (DUF336 family)
MTPLSLDAASAVADAAVFEARKRAIAPLCVVVLDAGGHPLVLKRDDGAAFYRAEIARAKAGGCLGMGLGGRALAARAKAAPLFYQALGQFASMGLAPVPGGVLVRGKDGDLLGAVGVSGDTSDNDELCAVAGILAAGLTADTGAVAEP